MAPGQRRVAFSTKAKKKQLQLKRQDKRTGPTDGQEKSKPSFLPKNVTLEEYASSSIVATQAINQQPGRSHMNQNRYNLKFHVESREEIEERKAAARLPIVKETPTNLEIGTDFCFIPGLEFPKRPKWDYNLSQQLLDMKENKYFREYVDKIEKTFPLSELSYFELNLETWRQLWRVLEMSDILLVVVDARFPSLLFPPSLYDYVIQELKRDIVLVFNKIDLVPASVLVAWKEYFQTQFPLLHIIYFTSLPSYNLREGCRKPGLKGIRKKGKMRMAAEGAITLLEVCQKICGDQVDLSAWRAKIEEEFEMDDEDADVKIGEFVQDKKPNIGPNQQERFHDKVLTIGCIGQPNVGKSSLINAIMGRKVVSVSKTPGHTKHFQTIYLTSNVKLCDCPGLVFPSQLPKTLQILTGSFPIAHVREPYTTVGFLGKYLDLPQILKIVHPDEDESTTEWSAYDICGGWAIKRGFITKRTARPDEARAANNLLRLALEGRICLYLRPPFYQELSDKWSSHPEVDLVVNIQALEENESDASLTDEDDEYEEGLVEKAEQDDSEDSESEDQMTVRTNKFALLADE